MAKTPAAPPATPSQPPKFKTVVLPDAIRFVQAFSEDRQAGTLIFDNFVAGTAAGRGSLPGAELKKFTCVLQPDADKAARVRQVIRGYVSTVGSGSAALVVHSGGTTTLVDLAKAIKAAKSSKNAPAKSVEATRAQARAAATTLGFSVDGKPSSSDDYLVTIDTPVTPGTPLQTTILQLVDRLPGEDGSGAVLTVDTIDVEIFPGTSKK